MAVGLVGRTRHGGSAQNTTWAACQRPWLQREPIWVFKLRPISRFDFEHFHLLRCWFPLPELQLINAQQERYNVITNMQIRTWSPTMCTWSTCSLAWRSHGGPPLVASGLRPIKQ